MRKLAWTTVGFTYFLMVWGNLVSSTGSGLACPDWPLCHGTLTPPLSLEVVLEWGHRLLAFATTILILTTLYRALRFSQPGSALRKSGKSLVALLGLQILLGGTTVLLKLSVAVSTIHLIIATLVFSGLITIASVVTWDHSLIVESSPKLQRLAIAALGGMLIQFALGALVRHSHAGLACPAFPNCIEGSFLPSPFTFESTLAFFHRWWGIALLGVYVQIFIAAIKSAPALVRPARTALGLTVAQIILGIGTVMSTLNTHSRATHAAVGYALWGVLFYIALRAGRIRWLWKERSN